MRSLAQAIAGRGKEGVDAEQRGPLLETAVSTGCRPGQRGVGPLPRGGEAGRIHRGRPRRHGRGKGLRAGVRPVDGVASHVLERGLVAGNLDQLNCAQHGHPNQLEDDPDIEDQSEGVSGDVVAQRVIDDVALGIGCRRQSSDI